MRIRRRDSHSETRLVVDPASIPSHYCTQQPWEFISIVSLSPDWLLFPWYLVVCHANQWNKECQRAHRKKRRPPTFENSTQQQPSQGLYTPQQIHIIHQKTLTHWPGSNGHSNSPLQVGIAWRQLERWQNECRLPQYDKTLGSHRLCNASRGHS
jgi:hypothetical protein